LNLPRTEIAKQLGVHPSTVKRYEKCIEDAETDIAKDILNAKQQWLSIRDCHPDAGTAELIERFPKTYWKLYGYDIDWLLLHTPDNRTAGKSTYVDWNKRDAWCCKQVKTIAEDIRSKRNPLRRVTANLIGIALGWSDGRIHSDLCNMRKTADAIAEVVESHEDFAHRRLQIVASEFIAQQATPSRSVLIKAAGLSKSVQTKHILEDVDKYVNFLKTVDTRGNGES
jgi:hypothetical protein